MPEISASRFALAMALLAPPAVVVAQPAQLAPAALSDWPTWGYDEERTAWNRAEKQLSKANVANLRVQWNAKLSTPKSNVVLSTLTAPVVAAGIATARGVKDMLFTLGADDVMFAIDASNGAVIWQKAFPNSHKHAKVPDWLCPGTANATPVIDKARSLLFFMASDGMLRAVNLADGTEKMKPTEMVAPFARAWSLNLIDNVVYTTSGRACGQLSDPRSAMAAAIAPTPRRSSSVDTAPLVRSDPSAITAIDVSVLGTPEVTRFFTSGSRPAGPWGRGGLARGPGNSLIFETSDGLYDPAAGAWGDTIVRLSAKAVRVQDSFTPSNHEYILSKDLGGSASPVVFEMGGKTLIAVSQKEGVLRILDAADMGGGTAGNHAQPLYQSAQLGNDAASGTDPSQGVWGAITTYKTPDGRRFVYIPMWGPPSKDAPVFGANAGPILDGSIMAFEVTMVEGKVATIARWTSPNMIMPDPVSVANGVVFAVSTGGQALQNPTRPDGSRIPGVDPISARKRATPVSNLVLYALDAETGRQLYSSGTTISGWVHFGEPVVALGKVFVVTHDAQVYAFGVDR
jgi:PQQ-like domain